MVRPTAYWFHSRGMCETHHTFLSVLTSNQSHIFTHSRPAADTTRWVWLRDCVCVCVWMWVCVCVSPLCGAVWLDEAYERGGRESLRGEDAPLYLDSKPVKRIASQNHLTGLDVDHLTSWAHWAGWQGYWNRYTHTHMWTHTHTHTTINTQTQA